MALPSARRTYCSWACYVGPGGGAQEIACQICGKVRRVKAAVLALGEGKYCSLRCRGLARRKPALVLTCEQCGCQYVPSQRKVGRFCSRGCFTDFQRKRPTECAVCRDPIPGRGSKYCSRDCYYRSKRKPEVVLTCVRCRTGFSVAPSAARRKYCTRQCFHRERMPATFPCEVCREPVRSKPSRRQHFCSYACRNRGRQRDRRPADEGRNLRILELYARGLSAAEIQAVLREDLRCVPGPDGAAWRIGAAGVRQVISRELRLEGGRGRRFRAIRLLGAGQRAESVAALLGCSAASVYKWSAAWRRHGPASLDVSPGMGRPPELGLDAERLLEELLAADPRERGHRAGKWTLVLLRAELVGMGYEVSRQTIMRTLDRCGWRSRLHPGRKHGRRAPGVTIHSA
jgi:transposase